MTVIPGHEDCHPSKLEPVSRNCASLGRHEQIRHLAVLGVIIRDDRAKILRSARDDFRAIAQQDIPHRCVLQRPVDRLPNNLDHGRRSRREEPDPGGCLVAGQAGLRDRGHVGQAGERSLPPTASALTAPLRICGINPAMKPHMAPTWLPTTAWMAPPVPGNGTCTMLTPAMRLKISPARWFGPPTPEEAKNSWPGLSRASAM